MSHAEICPICHGKGKIPNPENVTAPTEITCHGCNGRGWVEISDEYPSYPYYPPIFPDDPYLWYPYWYKITITYDNYYKPDNWEGLQ